MADRCMYSKSTSPPAEGPGLAWTDPVCLELFSDPAPKSAELGRTAEGRHYPLPEGLGPAVVAIFQRQEGLLS